ncbi:MAG: PspA/IM30 family protein [Gemmatimonadota bacterium]
MSIFQRISSLFKSNINDLINRAENPEKMLNQIIVDMRDQLSNAKREVAAAIADERKLRAQLDEEAKQARDWEQRAMLAVREGRDDLARQALLRQQEHGERAASLDQTWRAQAAETEKLKQSLKQLNDRIEEARRKRNLLIAKQKRAQAQRRIHETMSGLSDTSAFDAFNRMAEKIEDSERRSLAQAEVTEALSGDTLEKEFVQLQSGDNMESRLLALKQEMGLLPAGEKEERKQLGAGDGEEEAVDRSQADGKVVDATAQEDDGSDNTIHEAQLLEEFDRLQQGGETRN